MSNEIGEDSQALEAATALSVQKQINTLISLGFDEVLGMDETEYMGSFGGFSSMIPPSGVMSDIPVVVDPRIPAVEHLKMADIRDYYDPEGPNNEFGGKPYLIWLPEEDSDRNDAKRKDLRQSTLLELLSVAIQRPDLVKGKRVVAGAAAPDKGNLPYLNASTDSLWLGSVYKPIIGKSIYTAPGDGWTRGPDMIFEPLTLVKP